MLTFALPQISPSLSGAVISNPGDDVLLNYCSAALDEANASARKAVTAASVIFANPTMTQAAQHLKSQDVTAQITKPALQAVDRARAQLIAELERLRAATHAAPPPKDFLACEIRNGLASMDAKTRRLTVQRAIDAGDDSIIGALLAAPPFLSGYSAEEVEHAREVWRRTRHAETCSRIDALGAGLEHIERGGKILQKIWLGCSDQHVVEAARKGDAAVKAAVAGVGLVTH